MLQELFDFFGRAICHQIEERSLQAAGAALSVCARDTGIYIGIFSTLLYLHLSKRKANITIPTIKISFFLLLLMVPLIVDGLGSYLHIFDSNNLRRLVTGICFGLALPYFLYPLLSRKALEHSSEPAIKNSTDFFAPVLLSILLGGLVYWGRLPHFAVDGFIVLTVIGWFSLCVSFLFSALRNFRLKMTLSVLTGIAFLSMLSMLHEMFIT